MSHLTSGIFCRHDILDITLFLNQTLKFQATSDISP